MGVPQAISRTVPPASRSFAFTGLARRRPDLSLEALARTAARMTMPKLPPRLAAARQAVDTVLEKRLGKAGRGGAASLEQRMLRRMSFGWTLAEQEEIETQGIAAYLDRQLRPETIDDFGLEDLLLEAFPSLSMSPAERIFTYYEEEETVFFEFLLANFYRTVYSPRQLFERLVSLWTDHFNVYLFSDFGLWLKPTEDLEVIRRHANGSFPDLLRASAHSPAMLDYLTNDSNVAGHPNENYARELMELHTLGVDGGYTETDVKEVARCLTGWSFFLGESLEFGRFRFFPEEHDTEAKTVLGETIPAGGGIEDGERVLDLLVAHSSTARFVSTKILRHFWGYEPDAATVDKMADLYLQHDGDIPTLVEATFRWWRMTRAAPKVKRPVQLIHSSLRALFAEVEEPLLVLNFLLAAGQLPFNWGPPNGYPDSAGYWSGYLLPRFDWGSLFLAEPAVGVRVDLPFLDPEADPALLRDTLDLLLTGGTLGETTRAAVESYLRDRPAGRETVAEAIGLVVASPEFQEY